MVRMRLGGGLGVAVQHTLGGRKLVTNPDKHGAVHRPAGRQAGLERAAPTLLCHPARGQDQHLAEMP